MPIIPNASLGRILRCSLQFLARIACLWLVSSNAFSATIIATGWNRDLIYEDDSNPLVTDTMDGGLGGFTFSEDGLVVGGSATAGLPSAGTLVSAAAPGGTATSTAFSFQSYSANNALWITEGGSAATLTLQTPERYGSLQILSSAGNGGKTVTVTLTFTDLSTGIATFNAFDWGTGGEKVALGGLNRVIDNSGTIDGQDPEGVVATQKIWNIYEDELDLTTLGFDSKPIESITFEVTSGNPNSVAAVFAISGVTVPEPSAIGMLALGVAGLGGIRPRRESARNLA